QRAHHFAELIFWYWLIGRIQQSHQARTPTYRRAGRIHAMFPVIFRVAIALPPLVGKATADKFETTPQQAAERKTHPGLLALPSPPLREGTDQVDTFITQNRFAELRQC